MTLYRRKISLTVDTLKLDNFDIEFEVERTKTREPNTLAARVYNLSESTRNKLQSYKKGDARVLLSAGYDDRVSELFLGDLRTVKHSRSGPDIITEIEAGDGEQAAGVRFRKSYGKGTSLEVVIRELAEALGVGIGNIGKLSQISEDNGLNTTFVNGVVVNGYASDEMARLLASKGIDWSIQDNKLQLLGFSEGLKNFVTVLSPASGLIGVPTVDNRGILTAQCLIIPEVFPGRRVQVKSESVEGVFIVERATYTGSLFGTDFYINLEARKE